MSEAPVTAPPLAEVGASALVAPVPVQSVAEPVPASAPAAGPTRRRRNRRDTVWSTIWPPLVAVAMVVVIWEIVALSHWKPDYLLPAPTTVLPHLFVTLEYTETWQAIGTTMSRGLLGFAASLVIGAVVGIAVARVSLLRRGVGSLVSALQTMPSVAWFPLALLLFGLNESAILFVVILGAAPSIANGFADGIATVPPQLVRVGQVIGARGLRLYSDVLLPAALPSVVASMRQAWAFAWRSLLAGELLTTIPGKVALGQQLSFAQDNSDAVGLLCDMILLLVIGVVVDLLFRRVNGVVLQRRGLTLSRA